MDSQVWNESMGASGERRSKALGLYSQPDSAFGSQQREGTRPLTRGKHWPWSQESGKRKGKVKVKGRQGERARHNRYTPKGRATMGLYMYLNFSCKNYMPSKVPWSSDKKSLRNCHRLEDTTEIWQLSAMWFSTLDPGREKGHQWKNWGKTK